MISVLRIVPQLIKKLPLPPILWNPNVNYRIHKRPPPVSILIQINPVHDSLSHVLKLYFNIILTPYPTS